MSPKLLPRRFTLLAFTTWTVVLTTFNRNPWHFLGDLLLTFLTHASIAFRNINNMPDTSFCQHTVPIGRAHKWQPLFKAYLTGKPIKPFAASEIHGEDAARAVGALLRADPIRVSGGIFNAADFIVDRRDVLGPLKIATGCVYDLPKAADRSAVSIMNCDKMKRLEWRTGGAVKLSMTLSRMIKPYSDVA
jgi:hypothetical protein